MFAIVSIVVLAFAAQAFGEVCPSGGEIYAMGISDQGKVDVAQIHNELRQRIMDGTVPNQPRGRDLKTMVYDQALGDAGRVVSLTCEMNHIIAEDDRWNWVGQNLFISWSSAKSTDQNWSSAINSWFSEHKNFIYPDQSTGGVTGHYTQVVWANSDHIGCDFIAFYDKNQPRFPYAKLYTCNYGPGGNIQGQAPYPLA